MEKTIFGVGIMPNHWPPKKMADLVANNENGRLLCLQIDVQGCFVASISEDGAVIHRETFSPVSVPPSARFIFCLAVSDQAFELYINGHPIPHLTSGVESISLPYSEEEGIQPSLVIPNLNPPSASNDEEHFFLSTLQDIDFKTAAGDRYSLIRASGLLRQVLLDKFLHMVNRNYKLPIKFNTIDFHNKPPTDIAISAHWQNLDPSYFPGAKTIQCSLDQFLGAPCLVFQGNEATVKDLIKACANAKGGVHLGKARISEQIVLDWDEAITLIGQEPSLMAIRGICRVVLTGLKDLALEMMNGAI
jgi:hypothetical protein